MGNVPRVLVAQPSYAHVAPAAHAAFVSFILGNAGRHAVNVFQTVDMYVDNARNAAIKYALGETKEKLEGITHVLFIDADMVPPMDGLDRLLVHRLPSVSGLYFKKRPPFSPVAFNLDPFTDLTYYEENTLMEVGGVGMGFALVETQVFRDFQKFFGGSNEYMRAGSGIGEDVWFYMQLKKMGVRTYLDTSVKCGHVGEVVITADNFLNEKPKEKEVA